MSTQLINDAAAARAGRAQRSTPSTLAFNVVPLPGTLDDQGDTDEEIKMLQRVAQDPEHPRASR